MTRPCRACGSTERYKAGDCAPCARAASKRWREENPYATRVPSGAPCAKCGAGDRYPNGDCKLCARRRSTETHRRRLASPEGPAVQQRKNLRVRLTKYRLTQAELEALHVSQHGACAICEVGVSLTGQAAAIDHDHLTGDVRGLLCRACNQAIGIMRDSPARLRAAASYIERHLERRRKP